MAERLREPDSLRSRLQSREAHWCAPGGGGPNNRPVMFQYRRSRWAPHTAWGPSSVFDIAWLTCTRPFFGGGEGEGWSAAMPPGEPAVGRCPAVMRRTAQRISEVIAQER